MPYIPKGERYTAAKHPTTPGELTYALTEVMVGYLGNSPRFQDYAEVLGAVEAAKLEFYRRQVAPYETGKMTLNGDVYPRVPGDLHRGASLP